MAHRVLDLRFAGIGGEDLVEVAGQANGSLARSGAAVPRGIQRRRFVREKIEQRIRIARAKRGVGRGNTGEMIREAHDTRLTI